MVERKAFLMKPKHHCHLSQWGEHVYGAQSRKKDIITYILVCPNWRMNFDSKKMVKGKAFPMKPKHQCHLSHWGECVYGA